MKPALLQSKVILVTRPDGREKHLRQLINEAGGESLHYSVLNIQPPTEIAIKELQRLRDQLHAFDIAIFISPTAVEQSQVYFPVFPEHMNIVSIGSKTTKALQQQNFIVDVEAPLHNSESLLQTDAFQLPNIQGRRILIFRGTGGRALLGDALINRGAQIRYVETYQRKIPTHPPLTTQQIDKLDAITVSSNQGLDNLVTLMENPGLLVDTPIVVPAQRTKTLARQHGFTTIIVAENATDEATVIALAKLFSSS